MTQDKPLTELTLRRFSVSLPLEDYDRLTALSLRNTVSRSAMGWIILHQGLDSSDQALQDYYRHLSEEQQKAIWQIEHTILGLYKKASKSGIPDLEGQVERVTFSIPSYDNRRLIGHASRWEVSKSEAWRRIVCPWLRSQDDAIARFWQSACEWLGKDLAETKAMLIRDFDEQGR